MRITYNILACILCVILTIYSLSADFEILTIFSRIGFKVFLLLAFSKAQNLKISKTFTAFLILIFLTDVLSFFSIDFMEEMGYAICTLFLGSYILLIKNAWGNFKMNKINYSSSSLYIILVINAVLIGLHIRSLITAYNGGVAMIVGQAIYNVTLWAMIAISLAYYLNSYSKKSMVFLVGSIMFLCSDILYGSYYFYGVGSFILPFSVLLSSGGYVFLLYYFQIEEEPLLLESDILMEIEAIEKRKLKHQV